MKLAELPRGSVVLVGFPFTDLSATKVRPALVLSTKELHRRHHDVILAAISSIVPRRAGSIPTSVILAQDHPDFRRSGLRITSAVHCGKLVTVQGTLVLKRLGMLGASAMAEVDVALRVALGLARGK